MRTGPPTGPDLALLRELDARELDWFLTGRVAAAVQGVPLAWSTLDIETAGGAYPTVHAAQQASGHEPQRWPPPSPAEHSPVRLDAHREDPARPVTHAIRRALAGETHQTS